MKKLHFANDAGIGFGEAGDAQGWGARNTNIIIAEIGLQKREWKKAR